MSAKLITEKKKQNPKDTILKEITLQLSQALPAIKESLGEKKFGKRIKKAGKLLIKGIKPSVPKKTTSTKSTVAKPKVTKSKISLPVKKTAKAVSRK